MDKASPVLLVEREYFTFASDKPMILDSEEIGRAHV